MASSNVRLCLFVMLANVLSYLPLGSSIRDCGGKAADVEFVIDTSGSINPEDFQKQLQFTRNVVRMFDIGENKTRVGIISFSTNVHPEFGLGDVTDKDQILSRIETIRHRVGGTNTDLALNYLWSTAFGQGRSRENVPHVAIVLTDGQSYHTKRTHKEAIKTHAHGITVFVIGIGNQIDETELDAIASVPKSEHKFPLESFDALDSIKEELALGACNAPLATTPAPATTPSPLPMTTFHSNIGCSPRTAVELGFGFDMAGIGTENSKYVIDFISKATRVVTGSAHSSTVTTIYGECAGSIREDGGVLFRHANSANEVTENLSSFKSPPYNKVLEKLRLQFRMRHMKKIGVIFLDKFLQPVEYAMSAKQGVYFDFLRIKLVVIGVGRHVSSVQGRKLAMNDRRYLWAPSFEDMSTVVAKFLCSLDDY